MGKDVRIVIGANYGDEGKGSTVNWLLNEVEGKKAVVRFNGGAQAGHTVVTNSHRHVCSHYGAGVLNYIPTILTSDFVCSPHLFMNECKELTRKGVFRPDVYVSPDCPVTTPWDMMMNQTIETLRGSGRHGSVGVGFGETVHRHEAGCQLTVGDLSDLDVMRQKLTMIVNEYFPARFKELGITEGLTDDQFNFWFGAGQHIILKFLEECQEFLKRVTVIDENIAYSKFDSLVFEGAQGLALDQNGQDFPHVTRSNTGLKNAMASIGSYLQSSGERAEIRAYYVTRPYLTRHGAGPLNNEQVTLEPYFAIVDETNRPHDFQGALRFALLDVESTAHRIRADKSPYEGLLTESNIVLTCVQQIPEVDSKFPVFIDGKTQMISRDHLLGNLLLRTMGHYAAMSFSEQYYGFNIMFSNKNLVQES